ncbi:TetR/AcrR family transcriptional regulator [Kitasatospora sp. DSM 101779]|uniref:TetR/AcrR family transcriptional regulator n=1 Tax=Kitasatospora sp. DSM 101779 TaxID=2853165 RepID=UPI0021DA5DE0|nr:TetR/AcrR family transcriptional regulator C-terminal domain-containing protein [Kitasatospora sp. DSM 101779]MCU7827234.1 TetR/AcrR family transcriptional regulator C-terminal domain-containing protein [Kitasatospora sp. DSM 101779]
MPRNTLTRDQIIRTAVELLDEEGLEGLNMRSLGKRLDSAATAVYWHVKNKDELVLQAADLVWHEIELPDPGLPEDWCEAAIALAVDLHEMFERHPWLVQAFGSYLFYGRGKARYDDHCLALYERAGFAPADADRIAASVFTYVLGNGLGLAATVSLNRRLSRDGQDPQELIAATMAKAAEVAQEFPRLRARLAEPIAADYAAAPEHTLERGLRALLAGMEAELPVGECDADA